MKITNNKKLQIQSWDGFSCDLSDQVFRILDDDHPSYAHGYGKGSEVRLIRLPQGKLKIGEHSFNKDYFVVCSIKAESAEFCGVEKKSLEMISGE